MIVVAFLRNGSTTRHHFATPPTFMNFLCVFGRNEKRLKSIFHTGRRLVWRIQNYFFYLNFTRFKVCKTGRRLSGEIVLLYNRYITSCYLPNNHKTQSSNNRGFEARARLISTTIFSHDEQKMDVR